MDTYKSEPAAINAPIDTVFAKLSRPLCFKNIEAAIDVPAQVKEQVKDVEFGEDTISFDVSPVGNVTLKVTSLQAPSRIEYTAVSLPIPFKAVINLEADGDSATVAVAELQVELSMFLRPMVRQPLTDAALRFGQMLAVLPYDAM